MKNSINIFSETGCIRHEMLWKYRQGKLSAAEKHAVEVHLTDCELCSDALAGMMALQSDEMISGLRKSVRKISAPKKVIRFYDYRILSAAAAAAVLIVFTYVINSSDKQEKKEIAQLTVPPAPQEPKKNEQAPVADLDEKGQYRSDTAATDKSLFNGFIASKSDSSTPPPATLETTVASGNAEKQTEPAEHTIILHDDALYSGAVGNSSGAVGWTAPAQPAEKVTRDEEEKVSIPAYKQESDIRKKSTESSKIMCNDVVVKRAQANTRYRSSETKDKSAESSKIMYINDLKVANTAAMSASSIQDTVITGTPAMYENEEAKSAETPIGREMPFVYSKTLRDGMNYFHNKQYSEASQTFSIILERLPDDINSQFYKGLSEMEMQNYSQSSALLNKAMLNSDHTFYEEAKFKLALCYIALDQKNDAEKLLNEIKDEKGFYSEKAAKELKRLK